MVDMILDDPVVIEHGIVLWKQTAQQSAHERMETEKSCTKDVSA